MNEVMEKELEITGGFKGNAGVALQEADWMLKRIPQGGVFIEIGTYHGVTAAYLASRRPDATFISVDPFPDPKAPRDKAINIVGAADYYMVNRRPNMRLFVGTCADLTRFFGAQIADVVFADGNHLYDFVLEDLAASVRLLKSGGVIFAHDFGRPTIPDVERACRTFCTKYNFKNEGRVWHTALLSPL